jgi:hypothetical protein
MLCALGTPLVRGTPHHHHHLSGKVAASQCGLQPPLSFSLLDRQLPFAAQERLLELRREKFEEERANETEEQLQQELADDARMKIIVDERARILAAHAKNLDLKHLPKGVLATDADFAIFSQQ